MKRSSITLNDAIAEAVEVYIRDQEAHPTLTAVVQAALEQFLGQRGYLATSKPPLRVTPAARGSGHRRTSVTHDAVLAEAEHHGRQP